MPDAIRRTSGGIHMGAMLYPQKQVTTWCIKLSEVDPIWELAANLSLEEIVTDLQFEGIGNVPDNFDSQEIPTELEGIVPVPAAAWLFGSALGILGWMRRKVT